MKGKRKYVYIYGLRDPRDGLIKYVGHHAAETKWINIVGHTNLFNVYRRGSRRDMSKSTWTVEFDLSEGAWLRMFASRCGLKVPAYLRRLALEDIASHKARTNAV